jgi:enamine deaminase RidA (YjgF/YER057c/UK114 family)
MARQLISTGSPLEKQAGYSRAVVAGPWCFVSGTTGYDYASMEMPRDAAEQTRNILATIRQSLTEGGFAMEDVVRARYIVTDRAFVEPVMAELGKVFGDIRPAATMVIAGLVDPAMKVEIDVTAYRDG